MGKKVQGRGKEGAGGGKEGSGGGRRVQGGGRRVQGAGGGGGGGKGGDFMFALRCRVWSYFTTCALLDHHLCCLPCPAQEPPSKRPYSTSCSPSPSCQGSHSQPNLANGHFCDGGHINGICGNYPGHTAGGYMGLPSGTTTQKAAQVGCMALQYTSKIR